MRIAYIAGGAGAAYCGACIRDLALVDGLRKRGHDIDLLAFYTPLKGEIEGIADTARIFYGGINVFLQQTAGLFRRPGMVTDRLFDHPRLLSAASRFMIETDPAALGPMTVSVLAGAHGRQRKELERFLDHLAHIPRPDLVCITNSLLSGVAPELKRRFGIPIVCNVQGEDSFLEALPPEYLAQCTELMQQNARSIDLFVAPGEAHGRKMAAMLALPHARLRVVPVGIEASTFAAASPRPRSPFVIGYLSVIAPRKGLDVLVDAFTRLVNEERRDVVLRVAGRPLAPSYWRKLSGHLATSGLRERHEYVGEPDLRGKVDFLHRCSTFSVPSRIEESRGMAMMEAMAAGIPVAAPSIGTYPELLGDTGELFRSGNAASLARSLARLMDEPDRADAMGRAAAMRIAAEHTVALMLDRTEEAYASVAGWPTSSRRIVS